MIYNIFSTVKSQIEAVKQLTEAFQVLKTRFQDTAKIAAEAWEYAESAQNASKDAHVRIHALLDTVLHQQQTIEDQQEQLNDLIRHVDELRKNYSQRIASLERAASVEKLKERVLAVELELAEPGRKPVTSDPKKQEAPL